MKKRLLPRLFLLVAIAIAGFLFIVWLTAPTNVTTIERFAKIRGDETRAELEELLGAPGLDRSGPPPAFLKGPPNTHAWTEWQTRDRKVIAVSFDEFGKVNASVRFEAPENWLDKVRRWLRLAARS